MKNNIQTVVSEVVAAIHRGRSLKVTPAIEALPHEEVIKLAIEGLSVLVNQELAEQERAA